MKKNIQKQYRGADKNQATRTVTSRGGKQSFTDHVCEAGYHSHGDRKCHVVTEKHNGQTIIDMGGEWAYRTQHPSIQFTTPMQQQPYPMMAMYGNTAMTKMLRDPSIILMKQGIGEACPSNEHSHPGYTDCHAYMQRHKSRVIVEMGGKSQYESLHPFDNLKSKEKLDKKEIKDISSNPEKVRTFGKDIISSAKQIKDGIYLYNDPYISPSISPGSHLQIIR